MMMRAMSNMIPKWRKKNSKQSMKPSQLIQNPPLFFGGGGWHYPRRGVGATQKTLLLRHALAPPVQDFVKTSLEEQGPVNDLLQLLQGCGRKLRRSCQVQQSCFQLLLGGPVLPGSRGREARPAELPHEPQHTLFA